MTARRRFVLLVGTVASTAVVATVIGGLAHQWDLAEYIRLEEMRGFVQDDEFRMTFADSLRAILPWGLRVAAFTALVMVATHHAVRTRRSLRWLPATGAALLLGVWVALAAATDDLEWPVPSPPVQYNEDWLPAPTLAHPGVIVIATVFAALVLGGWVMMHLTVPSPLPATSTTARAAAWVVAAVPAVLLATAGLWLLAETGRSSPDEPVWGMLRWNMVTVAAAVALVTVALVSSGSGPMPFAAVLTAGAVLVLPLLDDWYSGGDDRLLGTCAALLAAVLVAWARLPVARGFDQLRWEPVPERQRPRQVRPPEPPMGDS